MGLVSCCGAMCLGHESSGIVVQLGTNIAAKASKADAAADEHKGDDTKVQAAVGQGILRLGSRVALEPGVTCRMCAECRSGQYQICEHMEFAAYPPFDGTLQRYYKL